jgi:hypothetical protein
MRPLVIDDQAARAAPRRGANNSPLSTRAGREAPPWRMIDIMARDKKPAKRGFDRYDAIGLVLVGFIAAL